MDWRRLVFSGVVTCSLFNVDPALAQAPCFGLVGDCDQDGTVTIGELVTAVSISLGNTDLARCPAADSQSDGRVSVNELIRAVTDALEGCDCADDCDDGNPCTRDGCFEDRCSYGPIECPDDGNECTAESCDVGSGCISGDVDDGVSCNGGAGECQSGVCVVLPSPTRTETPEPPTHTPTSTATGA
jgi:hypothetical protein